MCGIVGIIARSTNGFTLKETEVFKNMLFLDTLRGIDSTGVFGVDKKNNVLIHKAAVHGLDFIRTPEYKDFDNKLFRTGALAVGHNRAATRGTVEDKNAHPFWVDDKIVLVQNGTYYGCHKHLKDTVVDTDAIAHVIAEEDDVEKALQRINSAYALVWYNVATRKLNIIRNEQRPLYLARSEDGSIMFASEAATIFWAASREAVKIGEAPTMIPSGTLHTFEIHPDGNHTEEVVKLDINYRSKSWGQSNFPHNDYKTAWDKHLQAFTEPHGNGLDDDCDVPFAHGAVPRWVYPSGNETRPVGVSDVQITFSEYASERLLDSHMDATDAVEFNNRYMALELSRKTVMVELVDYIPANNKKDCKTFFVYGNLLDVKELPGPTPLAYWLVTNTDEETVLNMCTKQVIFSGRVSSTNIRHFLNSQNDRKALVYAFIGQPTAVETLTDVVQ